ncbi:capsular biosynthesis protein [Planococcus maritimus]|uniref:CapA family protein n=1 Tax=Planococcus maritimus TaxID=192421 RepID=UPI00080F2F96|nr:CapA family protein [Planococcus maritimus]ANU16489.1 capsular biosynthesis protein [Planococcus maritimus]
MAISKKWCMTCLAAIGILSTSELPVAAEPAPTEFTERSIPLAVTPERLARKNRVSLSAIGDVLIHELVYEDAKTGAAYNFDSMFEPIQPFLETADVTIANSESIVGGSDIGVSTYPSFNSPFELGDAMKATGIDAVSMANNHTLDRGVKAIENAVTYWGNIGVVSSGAYLSAQQRADIPVLERNGITLSFLSYTYGTNGIPTPASQPYLVNRIDRELIREDLAAARKKSDVTVLSLHFGNEYEPMPTQEQLDLARFAADNGADIILGHHPHVLQPPAWIDTADGRRSFVFYSLGNFLSGQKGVERRIGGIAHLEIEKRVSVDGSSISLTNPAFTPTFVQHQGYEDYEVLLLKDISGEWNDNTKAHLATWIPELEFRE